jgi:hypothetical protein
MLAALALAGAAGAPFPPCCAYGGSGGAVALGAGVLNAFSLAGSAPSGPTYAAPMAIGVAPSRLFTTILFAAASGPDDAQAGWIVTSNATNDVLFAFSNVSAAGPVCTAGVAPRGTFVADYRLCGGEGTLFPRAARAYQLTPSTRVGVFAQDNNMTTLGFADERACAPVALIGASSPLGTGAFSINFESGVAAEPPASWSAPPAYCDGHWTTAEARGLVESLRKA